jgi:hypothetical protein
MVVGIIRLLMGTRLTFEFRAFGLVSTRFPTFPSPSPSPGHVQKNIGIEIVFGKKTSAPQRVHNNTPSMIFWDFFSSVSIFFRFFPIFDFFLNKK